MQEAQVMDEATHKAKDRMLRKLIDRMLDQMMATDEKAGEYADKEIGETESHESMESPAFEAKEDAGLVEDKADEMAEGEEEGKEPMEGEDDIRSKVRAYMTSKPDVKVKGFIMSRAGSQQAAPFKGGKSRKG